MIDLKLYFKKHFQPLDILGITSFSPLSRAIWRNTWGKGKIALFEPYRKRAHLSTHIAVTCIGKDGRLWIMEMDKSRWQPRYVSKDRKRMFSPEDMQTIVGIGDLERVRVYSGVKLTAPGKYFTSNIRASHVCWIGRFPGLDRYIIDKGNEWLFERYREGVPYDYTDVLSQWNLTKKLKLRGSSSIYICSELAQRCFEYCGILQESVKAMTPMNWQEFPVLITLNIKEVPYEA